MIQYTSKLPLVGTTIFTEMSLLAQQHQAVNLSQGFPDFLVDIELLKYLDEAAKNGFNQYAPLAGYLPLREEIVRKIEVSHQSQYNVESEITITAGATQAIFTIISTFINVGDEVIIIEPAYDCYEPAILMNGGLVKRIGLHYPTYDLDWNELRSLITDKTKMIIFNNPNNPTGKIFKQEDIDELIQIVKDSNIILLSDEVYENLTYDGKEHLSFARYPELKERSFIVASFGKLCHVTGWKVGYVVAPKDLMIEYRKVHQFNVFCVNMPAQYALAQYLKYHADFYALTNFFQKKRDYFSKALEGTKFDVLPVEGTYFLSVNYSEISDLGDKEFCYYLTKEHQVAAIPFSAFYNDRTDEKVIRFCFAKKEETLNLAIEKLNNLL